MVFTNLEMRRALTVVLDLARSVVIPESNEEVLRLERKKQLKAIELVEHLQNILFVHNLTKGREPELEGDDSGNI